MSSSDRIARRVKRPCPHCGHPVHRFAARYCRECGTYMGAAEGAVLTLICGRRQFTASPADARFLALEGENGTDEDRIVLIDGRAEPVQFELGPRGWRNVIHPRGWHTL